MNTKVIVSMLVLLVLAPFTLAASVSDLSFTSGSQEVTTIGGPSSTLTPIVTMSFSIETATALVSAELDMTPINENPVYAYTANEDITSLCAEQTTCVQETVADGQTCTQVTAENVQELLGLEEEMIDFVEGSCVDETTASICRRTSYSCVIEEVRLKPTQSNFDIPVSVWTQGENAAVREDFTLAASFTLDQTQPSASDIRTANCDQTHCYVSKNEPTSVQVLLSDDSPFAQRHVYFTFGGSLTQRFSRCDQGSCTTDFYVYTGACEPNEPITLRLASQSTDDVGNKFTEYISREVFCDAQSPIIDEEDISFSPPSIDPVLHVKGEQITIAAIVQDDSSSITATANLSTLINNSNEQFGDCEELSQGRYNCTWQTDRIYNGNHLLEFSFTDTAQRTTTVTKVINVLNRDVEISSDNLDFFKDIEAVTNSPQGYSRLALGIATGNRMEYPIYATFSPVEKEEVEILRTNIGSCKAFNGTDYIAASSIALITLPYPYHNYETEGNTNRINIVITRNFDEINDNFQFICEIEMNVKKGNVVYDSPAIFNVTIPLILKDSSLNSIGEAYAEKITQKQDLVTNGLFDTIGKVGNVLSTVGGTCSTLNKITTVYNTLIGTETVTTGCAATNIPYVGNACRAADQGVTRVNNGLSRFTDSVLGDAKRTLSGSSIGSEWLGIEEEDSIFDIACKLATCSAESRAQDENLFGSDIRAGLTNTNIFGGEDNKEYWVNVGDSLEEDLFTGVGYPDAKESIVSAVEAQCLPAIVYHMEKYREIECAQLACYKRMGQMGLDISTCDKLKAQSMCQAIYSEVFSASPTQTIEDLGDNINTIIQNSVPAVLKTFVSSAFCPAAEDAAKNDASYIAKLAYMVGCEVPKAIAQVSYMTTENTHSNTNFVYPELNGCDFALCDSENMYACGVPVPRYLDEYARNYIPPTQVPQSIALDPSAVVNALEPFIGERGPDTTITQGGVY